MHTRGVGHSLAISMAWALLTEFSKTLCSFSCFFSGSTRLYRAKRALANTIDTSPVKRVTFKSSSTTLRHSFHSGHPREFFPERLGNNELFWTLDSQPQPAHQSNSLGTPGPSVHPQRAVTTYLLNTLNISVNAVCLKNLGRKVRQQSVQSNIFRDRTSSITP